MSLASQLTTIPRGYALKGIGVDGKYGSGLSWSSTYAVAAANSSESINSVQVLTDVLTKFATVEEIKTGFQKIKVNGAKLSIDGNRTPPMHYTFHDANGKSIVVEYMKG
ncbi:MAG TPA: hypothetical protein DCW35_07045 [Polynucleobacter sp.]|nr:linear amide C-N hydrolase [Polynucleobacter necessarius]HAT39654.1 hypothetical protein [Polynucleobacter sp.]